MQTTRNRRSIRGMMEWWNDKDDFSMTLKYIRRKRSFREWMAKYNGDVFSIAAVKRMMWHRISGATFASGKKKEIRLQEPLLLLGVMRDS